MSITRTLMGSILMFGAMQAHASSDGTDSHCVVGKNRTLFNQCDYPVDVGFCVENPQQTKNFFDSSEAFKCPDGGLSTLAPGKEEGNILNGTVHWFACATTHRGTAGWKYVPGSGYKGHCAADDSSASNGSPPAERGLVRPGEPAVWSSPVECNDWFSEGAYWWRELDPATHKLMCKRPLTSSARAATAHRYIESKRVEAESAQRKRDDAARAEQLKRDEVARADQQFRTSLQTMNPGQLFARADELNTRGESARAREALRALIGRFPNHPLAAEAARQLTGATGSAGSPGSNEGGSAPSAKTSTPASLAPAATSRQAVDDSGVAVRASKGALAISRSAGHAIEPATMYAHKGMNLVTGDVGWVIATSPEEAAKLADEQYGYSHLASSIRQGRAGNDYLMLDFGWFAFVDAYVESAKYPGNLSRDGAKRVWAYAARSREEAIATAIREYDGIRGEAVAQFVYSGLVAKIDRSGRGSPSCSICNPDMLYRSVCSVGAKRERGDSRYLNRNPRLAPSQFEGAFCESNDTRPFMRAQERQPPPVFK
ncbi:hypothetical protein J2W32_006093 [Variovorax boronicumulans]|uniref:Uncharacterized protein n=1 Tax=Variovorax boronicumulans TaxID=436515 RepID=A0AAW8DC14_9BURK|nr:hypothetical protein [Variovorax boronicumulans]MDP9896885.1 hypothetical protein [Variovorax boronicumulans]MDQ0057018.1 hypothetical protein [Variovorax boronicumulans]